MLARPASERPRLSECHRGHRSVVCAALGVLGPKAKIVVAELVPAVVAWARGPMAEIFGDSLSDPRVGIRETDVTDIIRSSRATFDAILLDVDNGPDEIRDVVGGGTVGVERLLFFSR